MLLVPVQSSDIAAMGYDPSSFELQIQFTNGRIYSYATVPPELYAGLVSAPSKGSFFAQFVKKFPGLYPYTRIDLNGQPPVLPGVAQEGGGLATGAGTSILESIEQFEGLL